MQLVLTPIVNVAMAVERNRREFDRFAPARHEGAVMLR
jgi:hypothetical protein